MTHHFCGLFVPVFTTRTQQGAFLPRSTRSCGNTRKCWVSREGCPFLVFPSLSMIVTQPERVLLLRDIASVAHYAKGKVLDVGGGNGNRYRSLFTYESYTTLDINGESDIHASSEKIPLADGSVDTVLCFQLFHYFVNPLPHLIEMRRVLKRGGTFILSFPSFIALHPTTRCTFTIQAMRELCEAAGFKIIETKPRGHLPSAITQTVIRAICNKCNPHQNRSMYFVGPVSLLLTKIALLLEHFFKDEMFSMGYVIVMQ